MGTTTETLLPYKEIELCIKGDGSDGAGGENQGKSNFLEALKDFHEPLSIHLRLDFSGLDNNNNPTSTLISILKDVILDSSSSSSSSKSILNAIRTLDLTLPKLSTLVGSTEGEEINTVISILEELGGGKNNFLVPVGSNLEEISRKQHDDMIIKKKSSGSIE